MKEIYDRRSIRKFAGAPVEKQLVSSILEAGRAAPSAKNRQPWKYIVFAGDSKEEMLDVMESGIEREETGSAKLPKSAAGIADAKNTLRIMRQAPIIILVLNTNGRSPFIPVDADDRITEICDTLSLGASIENILLEAQAHGLGTLWIANTCFAYDELTDYLCTDSQLAGAIALGYPDETPAPRPRKKLEDIVEFRY